MKFILFITFKKIDFSTTSIQFILKPVSGTGKVLIINY